MTHTDVRECGRAAFCNPLPAFEATHFHAPFCFLHDQVAMLLFDVHVIKEATCFIGLQRFSSVPLIIYDAIFSAYLTVLFLLPILKLRKKTFESEEEEQDTAKLFAALRKNLFAAMISVTVSFGNILALVLFYNGLKTHECWSCCMVDVLVNSLVVCCKLFLSALRVSVYGARNSWKGAERRKTRIFAQLPNMISVPNYIIFK